MRLHRFCPKTKYSTCAAPQKVVGLCKVVAPKLRCCTQHSSLTTILFQNHFPKAASQTCYQLLSKDVNCSNRKTKTAPHSYAGQRLPKSCAPELLRLPPGKLFPKAAPNVLFYSYSPKLLFFTENVLQCCRSPKRVCKATAAKRLYFKALPPKLLSAVASEICFPNLPWQRKSCGSS